MEKNVNSDDIRKLLENMNKYNSNLTIQSGNKKAFTTVEHEKLVTALKESNENISESLKRSADSIKQKFESIFKGSEDDVKALLSYNEELQVVLDDLNDKMNQMSNLVAESAENTERLKEMYHASTEEIEKSLFLIEREKELSEELARLENEKNGAIVGTPEYDRALSASLKIQKEYEKVEDSIANSAITLEMFSEAGKGTNDELDKELDTRKKIARLIGDTSDAQDNYSKAVKKTNDGIRETNKVIKTAINVWKAVYGIAKDGFNKWLEVDDKIFKTSRHMGIASTQIRAYQKNILDNYGDMAARLGMTYEEMSGFQEAYAKNTGRAAVLTEKEVESLAGISKLVGADTTNEMVKNMEELGNSTKNAVSYLTLNRARAQAMGLDANKSAEMFAKNIKLASKYNFREGVNGVSKMTLLSQKLKFNMESIAAAADKFSTIDSAVETSANLQVLGGAFGREFANPLDALGLSLTDMEGFTKKVVNSVSASAIFNKQTGEVEMSPVDRQILKEASKQLGISYDEMWNMASQQAKQGDIEKSINKNEAFTEEDKAFIIANSQYDAESREHYIKYFNEDGESVRTNVKDVNKGLIDEIKGQQDVDKAIQGDVHGIHGLLDSYLKGEVRKTKTGQETIKGTNEAKDLTAASAEDAVLNWAKTALNDHLLELENIGWGILGTMTALKIGGAVLGDLIKDKFSDNIRGRLGNLKGKKGKIGSKAINALKGKGGKAALIGGLVLAGGTVAYNYFKDNDTNAANNNAQPKSKPNNGGNSTNSFNDKLAYTQNSTNSDNVVDGSYTKHNDANVLNELKKQTEYLGGITTTNGVIAKASTTKDESENSNLNLGDMQNQPSTASVGSGIGGLGLGVSDVLTFGGLTYATSKGGGAKITKGVEAIGRKVSSEKGAETAAKYAGKALKGVKVGTGLGLTSVGADLINASGQSFDLWNEGSNTDKTLNTASTALEYAGYGAMIGSLIPMPGMTLVGGALGGLAGAAKGAYDNWFSDEAKNRPKLDTSEVAEKYLNKPMAKSVDFKSQTEVKNVPKANPISNETYVKHTKTETENNNSFKMTQSQDINLNLSGNLRLTSNKDTAYISAQQLVDNQDFINNLSTNVIKKVNIMNNGGVAFNANSHNGKWRYM